MICPKCLVQMHQKDGIGYGKSTDKKYVTWEIKECPHCGRLVKEFYSCKVIEPKMLDFYRRGVKLENDLIIEPTSE